MALEALAPHEAHSTPLFSTPSTLILPFPVQWAILAPYAPHNVVQDPLAPPRAGLLPWHQPHGWHGLHLPKARVGVPPQRSGHVSLQPRHRRRRLHLARAGEVEEGARGPLRLGVGKSHAQMTLLWATLVFQLKYKGLFAATS